MLTIVFSWQTNSPLFLGYWRPLYYMITITTDLCPSLRSRKKFPWVNLPNRIFLSRHHDLFSCYPNSMGYFSKWYCKWNFPSCIDSTEKERWPKSMDFYHLTAIVWIFVSSFSYLTFPMGGAELVQHHIQTLAPTPVSLQGSGKLLWELILHQSNTQDGENLLQSKNSTASEAKWPSFLKLQPQSLTK